MDAAIAAALVERYLELIESLETVEIVTFPHRN